MDIALIPPFAMMHHLHGRKYQMILPECWKSPVYRREMDSIQGTYRILDNGMFEGSGMGPEELINLAIETGAHEIVMPDVREDMEGTLEGVTKFLDIFELTHFPAGPPNLMIVVQVDSLQHIPTFLSQAAWIEGRYFGAKRFVYGIPRRFVERFGPEARIHTVSWIKQVSPSSPIHLLGYARTYMPPINFNEVLHLRRSVRSLDTDAPYVWSYMGADLAEDAGFRAERPQKYFTQANAAIPEPLLRMNIKTLDRWAHV